MGEEGGPDSDSSCCKFFRSIARPRSSRFKEVRVHYSSRTTVGHRDPMPEYIDPELVKLIAQNAPSELNVFARPLLQRTKRGDEVGGMCRGAFREGGRGPLAIHALLSSVRLRNRYLSSSNGGKEFWRSCPERIWRDSDEEDEAIFRAKTVKRKRRRSLDIHQIPVADGQFLNEVSICRSDGKGIRELRGVSIENKVVSADSSNQGSCVEYDCLPPSKMNACVVSSAAFPHSGGSDCDMTNAKPRRHGTRKSMCSTNDDKPPESACFGKKRAEVDLRKTSECFFVNDNSQMRPYMETKGFFRKREQQQLKAEAGAALVTRKQQERKSDLRCQAILQLQVVGGKRRGQTPRPAWVSEYTGRGDSKPWSSSSSGELNIHLPPPVTPLRRKVVPLDLCTTQMLYAERLPPTRRVEGTRVYNTRPWGKCLYKKVNGCSQEAQRQLYRTLEIMKAFPHSDVEVTKTRKSPNLRMVRWKGKIKPRGKILSSENVSHSQFVEHNSASFLQGCGDLEVYKSTIRRQFYIAGSHFRAVKSSGVQISTARSSQTTSGKSMLQAESCVKTILNDHVHLPSKVKRLKPTQHVIAQEAKELSTREITTPQNTNRVPSDCESKTHSTGKCKLSSKRMSMRTTRLSPNSEQDLVTDLQKRVGHLLGSPRKDRMTKDVLKWFGPYLDGFERRFMAGDIRPKNRGYLLRSSLTSSRGQEVQVQVMDLSKENTGIIHRKSRGYHNAIGTVRWRRMHFLKNLAEQLMNRIVAACAKKRQLEWSYTGYSNTQFPDSQFDTKSMADEVEFEHELKLLEPEMKTVHASKPNNGQPSIHLAGSFQENKMLEPELKLLLPKQYRSFHCGGPTELKQAGCEILSVHQDEMMAAIQPNIYCLIRGNMPGVPDYTAMVPPISLVSTVMDWKTTETGMDITCNIFPACLSSGPSSRSISSSSPVILPASRKYNLGGINYSKLVPKVQQIQLSKKEDWTLPVEKDVHSISNLSTQHWKSEEREKVVTFAYPYLVQLGLQGKSVGRTEAGLAIAGPTAQEKWSTFGLSSFDDN